MSTTTTSSEQRSNKRVRVDPTATTIPDTSNTATVTRMKVPKARASATIATHTETLLPQLSTILKTLGDKHLDLLHRFYNKSNQLSRMEPDDTIIPRSARLKFELSVPKCIEELPDFQALQAECDSDVGATKLAFKKTRYLSATDRSCVLHHRTQRTPYSRSLHRHRRHVDQQW